MDRIASPQELQSELRRLLAYAEGHQPSREKLAEELWALAERVSKVEGNKLICDEGDGKPAEYIDSKGYVYCKSHGESYKRSGRPGVKKLGPADKKRILGDPNRKKVEDLYRDLGKDYP